MIALLFTIACAPADITFSTTRVTEPDDTCYEDRDGDGYVYPYDSDCHAEGVQWDYDDNDASVTTGPTGNADLVPETCVDAAAHTWVILDYEGGFHQDYEPSLAVLLDDGTWFMSENGWLELPTEPREPLGIQIVDLNNGHIVSTEIVVRNTMITLMDDDYVEVGTLVPTEVPDLGFVEYGCAPP